MLMIYARSTEIEACINWSKILDGENAFMFAFLDVTESCMSKTYNLNHKANSSI